MWNFLILRYFYLLAHPIGTELHMLGHFRSTCWARWLGFIEFSIIKLRIISKKIVITGPGGWPRTVGHDHWTLNQRGGKWCWLLIQRVAQNARDGAGLRSSVAAATPSQLRRSSASRTMSGRRGIGQPFENHWAAPRKICHRDTTATVKPSFFIINLPKELRPLPWQGEIKKNWQFWGGLKRAVFG